MKNMLKQARKSKKAALYTPYLDVLGGGELHVLSILKVLEDNGYEVFVFWEEDLREKIERVFGLKFKNLQFLPNIFKRRSFLRNALFLAQFEVFIYVPDGSYFSSFAKKNYLFCMVPERKLYSKSFLNSLKLWNYRVLANSRFTAKFLQRWVGKKVEVIYPYLSSDILNLKTDFEKKKERILNIGRFFKQLHSKKQDVIAKWFKKIKQEERAIKNIELFLAGRFKEEDKSFLKGVLMEARDRDDIFVKTNLSRKEVLSLLARSKYYWHFTGLGESNTPEKQEHLGISILEAMAAGCVVFAYRGGGPVEVIKEGETGFLFRDYLELKEKFLKVYNDKNLQKRISLNAQRFVRQNFSYQVFGKRVAEVFEI